MDPIQDYVSLFAMQCLPIWLSVERYEQRLSEPITNLLGGERGGSF